MKTGVAVGDAMTKKPITVAKEETVQQIARLMADRHVGSLIIVENGKATGLLTEQDMVRKVMAESGDAQEMTASDIMVTDLITVTPGADLFDALVLMKEHNIRHLPVVHEEELVGFLTIKDILKVQPHLFETMVDKFELREESRKPIPESASVGDCDACGHFSRQLRRDGNGMVCENCRVDEPLPPTF